MRAILREYRQFLPFGRSVLTCNRMIPAFFRPERDNTNQPFASHLFKVFFKRCCNGMSDDARTNEAAAEYRKDNRTGISPCIQPCKYQQGAHNHDLYGKFH